MQRCGKKHPMANAARTTGEGIETACEDVDHVSGASCYALLAPLALRLPRHSAPPPMRPHRQSLVDHSSANPRFSWPSPSWFCRHQFLRRPPSGHIGWPLNGWCGYNTKEATGAPEWLAPSSNGTAPASLAPSSCHRGAREPTWQEEGASMRRPREEGASMAGAAASIPVSLRT
uniref:Uncharacterized protein n=1 Tax=Oryza sativa subsp. japonica TaxID=39947 RepID=Q8H420_ORYSJ|nr:hypothetical protein [Oryza sativa Japonica Group]BAD31967.1 hypothetical protein [Oryza sativa Japonica Group]